MADSRRVVLVKPGDVLMIGNLDVAPEDVAAFEAALEPLREILGIPKILVFSDDIDLAVTSSIKASDDNSHGLHFLLENYGQSGWYDKGGTLPAGRRLAKNERGYPEPVAPPEDRDV